MEDDPPLAQVQRKRGAAGPNRPKNLDRGGPSGVSAHEKEDTPQTTGGSCIMSAPLVCMFPDSLSLSPLPHCPGKRGREGNPEEKKAKKANTKASAATLPEGESLIEQYPLAPLAYMFADSLSLPLTVQGSGEEMRKRKRQK